ncbi:MAG: alanine racemase [Desulfobacteraceae bacterium]|nr:alanine racemase [Desulfobacteraceae bacterium]
MTNWAEIDLKAIAHNILELRRITNPGARLMAVVKANAYGHGAGKVADQALKNGADMLGVARLNEGIRLRKEGIEAPILIFGYTPPSLADKLVEFNLCQTVWSCETARALSDIALSLGRKIRVHLKTDTGMGRLGLVTTVDGEQAALREVESIARLHGLELEGIFTHFASSDSSDKSYTKKQFERFMEFLDKLCQTGPDIPIKHAANSAAIIDMPETHLDMVRAGISLYGLYPSDEVDKSRISLKPAMEFKAKVIHLKKVPAGFNVSYGSTFQTEKTTTIATISAGYADGLNRMLSSRGHMLVCGSKAPVVGRVCMDLTMLDVGHIPDVHIEDEVVIFGSQGNSSLTVDEIASALNTINYEIVSTITDRVPRLYID